MLDKKKLDKIRISVRSHLNWLVKVVAGDGSLTKEEKAEVNKLNLPTPEESLIQRSYLLGRLKSILKKSEYKDITPSALDKSIKETKLSTIEKLVVEEAQLRAGNNLKRIAADIEAGVFNKLIDTQGGLINEAIVRGIVQDKTALAALENKTWKELASSLSEALGLDYGPKVERIARTELHSAKQKAIATAIASKVDIYGSSDGPDSYVSVVTSPGHCGDCDRLYNDKDGNPKIFKLSELLSNGTNATRNHKKVKGEHPHWVPVVPSAHPHCFCELKYIPPGYEWSNRRLVLKDKDKLVKAGTDNMGNRKGPTPPPAVGNISGVPKMGANIPKPGSNLPTPGASQSAGGGGAGITYEYWPKESSPPQGGNWEAYQKRTGGSGWRRPAGSGAQGASQEDETGDKKAPDDESLSFLDLSLLDGTSVSQDDVGTAGPANAGGTKRPDLGLPANASDREYAKAWAAQDHPDAVKLHNLNEGVFADVTPLGGDEAGVTDSYIVDIKDDGSALMKPPMFTGKHDKAELYAKGELFTEGAFTVPVGTGAKREAAAYAFTQALGLQNTVPPTVLRNFANSENSFQTWEHGFEPIHDSFLKPGKILNEKFKKLAPGSAQENSKYANVFHKLLTMLPNKEERQAFVDKYMEAGVVGILMNHNDQHSNNILMNENLDMRLIDNSTAFGNGMEGVKSEILRSMTRMNMKLTVSEKLQERIKNTSLGDLKRALGDNLEDWAIGQTFLRGKYLLHLQDSEGHLDFEKFRCTIGYGKDTESHPRSGYWPGITDKTLAEQTPEQRVASFRGRDEFDRRRGKGLLPGQMFESFAKKWINDSLKLPEDHPDHIAAKELSEIEVFMPPGFAANPDLNTLEARREYRGTIKARNPPKNVASVSSGEEPEIPYEPDERPKTKAFGKRRVVVSNAPKEEVDEPKQREAQARQRRAERLGIDPYAATVAAERPFPPSQSSAKNEVNQDDIGTAVPRKPPKPVSEEVSQDDIGTVVPGRRKPINKSITKLYIKGL